MTMHELLKKQLENGWYNRIDDKQQAPETEK